MKYAYLLANMKRSTLSLLLSITIASLSLSHEASNLRNPSPWMPNTLKGNALQVSGDQISVQLVNTVENSTNITVIAELY
jgi:hypothetical protein